MSKFKFVVVDIVFSLPLLDFAVADDMKNMQGMNMSQPAAKQVQGVGIVKAVDAKAGTVTISHEAIKELKWPAMTMMFSVSKSVALDKVTTGKKVQFSLEGKADDLKITSIKVAE